MSAKDRPTVSRRTFLKGTAQALTLGVVASALPGLPSMAGGPAPAKAATLPAKPNLLILISDQERYPRNWPANWADTHLTKARQRLLANGLDFSRAFCSASMCSPSRGSLFTGLYPAQHGVTMTLAEGGDETTLSPDLPNLAHLLVEAGYDVQLRGKWHLSKGADGGTPSTEDLAQFGFQGWVPTNVGEALDVTTLAGGCPDMDEPTVDQAVAYLQTQTPEATRSKPFCLVVSLANPHDILLYPKLWDQEICTDKCYMKTADLDLGLTVPSSHTDDLALKPEVQKQALDLYALTLGTLAKEEKQLEYVNFYGYLQTIIDDQFNTVLQTLENQGLTNSTVVVRTTDHGELGLAHGGLRQKMFNAYEECLNIPLIFSNPLLFPESRQTEAYATLVDLVPTLSSLCGIPRWKWSYLPGRDLMPVLEGATQVQDTILFTFDDAYAGQISAPPFITEPCHIRCIIHKDADGEWKYARYFDPDGVATEVYEMYRLKNGTGAEVDPQELDNMANSGSPNYVAYAAKRSELAALLAQVEARRLAPVTPPGPPLPQIDVLLLNT